MSHRRFSCNCCLVLALTSVGCSSEPPPKTASTAAVSSAAPALAEVSLPDLSKAEEAVRVQARARYDALVEQRNAGASGSTLGEAYGNLAMVLHAAEYLDAASPAYEHAQSLMPDDPRWPYYLGLLHQARGETALAESAFVRALERQPDDPTTLVRIAQMMLARGEIAGAREHFGKASASRPDWVAPLAGLGQAALAEQKYEDAVRYLEAGLTRSPATLSLHAPLANAYRALGQQDRAEAQMKRWQNTEVPLPDAKRHELDTLLQSALSFELRGLAAMGAQDWPKAAALFREGVAQSAPASVLRRSLRHKLGTMLWMQGDMTAAVAEFRKVVDEAPASGADEAVAKAFYSLGIVEASQGRNRKAIDYFNGAVRYQPNYLEAHLALADALRRDGRLADSLLHYERVSTIEPRSGAARFGYAMALVKLERYVEARDWLVQSLVILPNERALTMALARVLASAPDVRARDGRRALALAESLMSAEQDIVAGETLAMALAEVGQFDRASSVQREIVAAAVNAGAENELVHLRQNLARYEQRQACRVPWPPNDPVFYPEDPG
jgi:tetratricopeptide (TPR) repeat protein